MDEHPRISDRWSTWLAEERFAGQDATTRQASADLLANVRDRVLLGAHLRPGAHVVDLGAGTGLLTRGAISNVGPNGAVTAIDISHAALVALSPSRTGPQLHRLVGNASRIPLTNAVADAVVVRSVLIYLQDLSSAFAEIARVLKHGGRLSVFEPVNSGRRHDAQLDGLTDEEVVAIKQLRETVTPASQPMLAFNEHKAVTLAEKAGLTVDTLQTDTIADQLADLAAVDAYLNRKPHPGAPSPLDLITTRLSPKTARRYQQAWHHSVTEHGPITFTTPVMFLAAQKHG
jgi:arsenite methyltransferase